MKKSPFIWLLLLLHQYFLADAQQTYNWHFGKKAAIFFAPNNGQLTPSFVSDSEMETNEGSSSISDENGELLFYTNGQSIYNRNNEVMLNGTGLKGHISACQSSAIVAVPGNDSIFYVFTTDAIENQYINGYQYSIVNMKRDNGLGEVISKNNLLVAPGTERMTLARNANGIDTWLITNDYNSNVFRVWRINCNGLDIHPQVFTLGVVLDGSVTDNSGYMKVSPDGKQLCQTHIPNYETGQQNNHFIQLFDFNNGTGVLSNARSVNIPGSLSTACEYSPDSKLLYLACPAQKTIDQVECTAPNTAAIVASRYTIRTRFSCYGIQRGPDGVIYLSAPSRDHLATISQPTQKGIDCNFIEEGVPINGFITGPGLPSFINDIGNSNPVNSFTYTVLDSCAGRIQFNGFSTMLGIVTWDWDFGDGTTATGQQPIHVFSPSDKTYTVTLTIRAQLNCGSITIAKPVLAFVKDTTFSFDYKNVCDSGYVRFINTNTALFGLGQFTWSFGDNTSSNDIHPKHVYSQQGSYTVKLSFTGIDACRNADTTGTVRTSKHLLTVAPTRTIVFGQSTQLLATAPGLQFSWSPATGLNNPAIHNPVATPSEDIVYTVTAIDDEQCAITDSILVHVVDPDNIYVPAGFTPNNDGKNDDLRPFFPRTNQLVRFSIFNRWGQQVFNTQQHGQGWDGYRKGIQQPAGVYIWTIALKDASGKSISKKGTVTLIR